MLSKMTGLNKFHFSKVMAVIMFPIQLLLLYFYRELSHIDDLSLFYLNC